MSWMRLAVMALGVATVICAYAFVPADYRAEVVGMGGTIFGFAMRWPTDMTRKEVLGD